MTTLHRLGPPLDPDRRTCGQCVWSRQRGPGPAVHRCVRAGWARVSENEPACARFEGELDCLECAACCREAFDAVEVSARDPVRKLHPELVVKIDGRYQIQRTQSNRCAALAETDWTCRIYEQRPRCCRDFERGGPNCVFARVRVGISAQWCT